MAKNHRKKKLETLPSKPKQQIQMRDREVARAYKALRSAELTKARQLITQTFNDEVLRHDKARKLRSSPRAGVHAQVPRRRLPDQHELRNSGLPAQVRHDLQDNIRAVVCQSRRTRRETLFALRRSGKVGKPRKKAKWTTQSRIRCK